VHMERLLFIDIQKNINGPLIGTITDDCGNILQYMGLLYVISYYFYWPFIDNDNSNFTFSSDAAPVTPRYSLSVETMVTTTSAFIQPRNQCA
jgi:hypothetical protein